MRRVVGAKLLRANGRKTPPCVFPLPARFFCCQPRCFVRQHPRSAALVLAFLRPPRFFCCQPRCFVRQHPRSTVLVLAFLRPPRFFCCQPRCFVCQHPRSAALVLAFPLPARFFCCQPRFFVCQHPRSAALVLAFLRPPRFFCCATALLRPSAPPVCRFSPRISVPSAFLLLWNRVSSAAQPRCRFAITPFRVYFSSLVAAKGFVLLNIRARRLAPLVVIVRGAQLFLAFLSLVSGSLRPFFVDKRCVFAVGC